MNINEFYDKFSVRTIRGLKILGIDSLDKLRIVSFLELLKTRGIGIICIREIWRTLRNNDMYPVISQDETEDDFIVSLYGLYPHCEYLRNEARKILKKSVDGCVKKMIQKPKEYMTNDFIGDSFKVRAFEASSGTRYVRIGLGIFNKKRQVRDMAKKLLAIADWMEKKT